MKKIFNQICIFLILCFITLFNTACEIDLGTAVDLTPPVLKITKPEVAQNVPQLITIEGYATDNIDVARVVVTIQETNQSYRLLAGDGWQMSVNGKWQPYEAGTSVFEDGKVRITIRDKGCGIADIEKAMEPLYTTAGEERAGLGFAVMESFTDRLSVSSTLGKGTKITMEKRLNVKYNG